MITITKDMIETLQTVCDFAERQKYVYRVVKVSYMPSDECAFVVDVLVQGSGSWNTRPRKMKVTYYGSEPIFEGWI